MSWFGNSVNTQELDSKIEEATSESIPNGEIDIAVAFEITDLIRSKKIPSKNCMRCLKKRLIAVQNNPNLCLSILKLIEVCVKNGGYHFLAEISSKEFMDYLVESVFKRIYNIKDYNVINSEAKLYVGNFILQLIRNWAYFFKNQPGLNYVERCYEELKHEYKFPDSGPSESNNEVFIDTETPADWVDNDECMICYRPFSMINRKHHCRSCGGVFDQEHSSKSLPLPSLGIMESVRVCDNCYSKVKKEPRMEARNQPSSNENDDDDLKKAIELSLRDSGPPVQPPPVQPPPTTQPSEGDEDEEMKAAIAASLKEFENQERLYKAQGQTQPIQPAQTQPQPDHDEFYGNILPTSNFQSTPSFQSPGFQSPGFQSPNYQSPSFQQPTPYGQPQQASGSMTPVQHIQSHQTQNQDLSPQEEESINLYITLINQLRNDPSKQSAVLSDNNLNELHIKVLKLKPKLNKSLRISIENYESFVSLNSKVSTIMRLYDQFLENKLSDAYNHNMGFQNYQYTGQQFSGQQFTGKRNEAQPSGSAQYSQGIQYTGMGQYGQTESFSGSGPQYTGQSQNGFTARDSGPQFTGEEPYSTTQPQYTGQPTQGYASEPQYEQSEPQYDAYKSEYEQKEQYQSEPQYPEPQYGEPQYGSQYDSKNQYESEPQYESESQYGTQNYQSQPQESEPQYGSEPQYESEPQYGSEPQSPQKQSEPQQYDYQYPQPTKSNGSQKYQYPSEPKPTTPVFPSVPSELSNISQYPPVEKLGGKEGFSNQNTGDDELESTKLKYPPVDEVETRIAEEPLIEL
ncbi:vacuolar protein sorting-associated protein 27 [[Candida] jaroonii]|uniref:Vacuolar protein sorting-associated protein 27 n=1 Tax=[Candida] jaroonii TaxID=467808 RepID=A0ACA9Y9L4_9ASCO|nr:vacuolar protein sorting-associated protein 27 [[Candida] jaroonii]